MVGIVYQIELHDSRVFRIFCTNQAQINKLLNSYWQAKEKIKELKIITNGVHSFKDFQQHLKTF